MLPKSARRLIIVLAQAVVLGIGLLCAAPAAAAPTPVILDTDMLADLDDVFALGMLHVLQDRGEVRLLAVTSSTEDLACAEFIDALDTWYGHPDAPVGMVRGGVTADRTLTSAAWIAQRHYPRHFSELRTPGGQPVYPHRIHDLAQVPDAVGLLRRTLARAPDGQVVMIQIGFSTNLARLLDSGPDAASRLSGRDLVARKVKLLSVMAGHYADAEGRLLERSPPEWNLRLDIPSAQRLFAAWPTPVVASGFEIGLGMRLRGADVEHDFAYDPRHPLAAVFAYLDPIYRRPQTPAGRLDDHPSFDMTSVLYAARPDAGYFGLSAPGRISVLPNGSSHFEPSPDGPHRFLLATPEQKARALEAITVLSSEPPRAAVARARSHPF